MKVNHNKMYFFALGLYLTAKFIEISSSYHTIPVMPKMLVILRYVSYALIIYISLFMTHYSRKVFVRYVVFMLICLTVSLIAKSVTILFNFMFIFAGRDIPIKKIIKFVVICQVSISTCFFLGTLAGLFEDWTYLIAGRFRHSMGYGYPNAIPTIYFYTMLAFCYLKRRRFTFLHLISFEILNYVLFYYTNTRTAFALTAIALIVLWSLKYINKPLKPTRVTRLIYVYSVLLIAIFAIMICWLYSPDNAFLNNIDGFISNRLSMGHNALMVNRLTPFGQKIQWYGFGGLGYTIEKLEGEYNNVDCSYVKILLDSGVILLSLVIIGYMYIANEQLKKGDLYFCMGLLFANLYAMIEPRYIETGFNPFVWCLSSLLRNELYLSIKNNVMKFRNRSIKMKYKSEERQKK